MHVRVLKVSEETYQRVVEYGKYGETIEIIMKRILGLAKKSNRRRVYAKFYIFVFFSDAA
jgi:hypothetical protein